MRESRPQVVASTLVQQVGDALGQVAVNRPGIQGTLEEDDRLGHLHALPEHLQPLIEDRPVGSGAGH